jgi:dTDP-4-amino-4,6-dideoxygalactose transaminase
LPSELVSAFLWAQMEEADAITSRRLDVWNAYHRSLEPAEVAGKVRRPVIPAQCEHNAHMYYLLLPDLAQRTHLIEQLKQTGISAVFHYVPLHSSPFGKTVARAHGDMSVTLDLSDRLVRLPLWVGLQDGQSEVIDSVLAAL